MNLESINADHLYRGDFYRVNTVEYPDRDTICLRVYNRSTMYMKTMEFSRRSMPSQNMLLIACIRKMMTSIWMRKYTPVDTKIGVATSELIEELLK